MYQQPMMQQPMMGGGMGMMGGGMMQQPMIQNFVAQPIPGVPLGLEVLHLTEHLFIRQSVDLAEMMYNAPNKYEVLDTWGRRIFFAAETSSFWDRNGCCNCAPFTMSILNFGGQEVLYAKGSQGCCCDANVTVGQGQEFYGSATELAACCEPKLDVKNAAGQVIFLIVGPGCSFGAADFNLFQPGVAAGAQSAGGAGNIVGRISKQWSGFAQEMFSTADNYGISFPSGLDVRMKAVLLGAALLIDFRYFENKQQHHRHRGYGYGYGY